MIRRFQRWSAPVSEHTWIADQAYTYALGLDAERARRQPLADGTVTTAALPGGGVRATLRLPLRTDPSRLRLFAFAPDRTLVASMPLLTTDAPAQATTDAGVVAAAYRPTAPRPTTAGEEPPRNRYYGTHGTLLITPGKNYSFQVGAQPSAPAPPGFPELEFINLPPGCYKFAGTLLRPFIEGTKAEAYASYSTLVYAYGFGFISNEYLRTTGWIPADDFVTTGINTNGPSGAGSWWRGPEMTWERISYAELPPDWRERGHICEPPEHEPPLTSPPAGPCDGAAGSGPPRPDQTVGNPVDLVTRAKVLTLPCLGDPVSNIFQALSYSSRNWENGVGNTAVGRGWFLSYHSALTVNPLLNQLSLTLTDGQTYAYVPLPGSSTTYVGGRSNFTRIEVTPGASPPEYQLVFPERRRRASAVLATSPVRMRPSARCRDRSLVAGLLALVARGWRPGRPPWCAETRPSSVPASSVRASRHVSPARIPAEVLLSRYGHTSPLAAADISADPANRECAASTQSPARTPTRKWPHFGLGYRCESSLGGTTKDTARSGRHAVYPGSRECCDLLILQSLVTVADTTYLTVPLGFDFTKSAATRS